ncbi:MAG: hypothetical protein ABGW63_05055 [Flavobacteriaceae bacterium]
MDNTINITFGTEALARLPETLQEKDYSSTFILVDTNTEKYCLPEFIKQSGLTQVQVICMPPGVENKPNPVIPANCAKFLRFILNIFTLYYDN